MSIHLLYSMLACVIMVVLTVLVHYECLRFITDQVVPRLHMHPRPKMVFVILGVFLAHTLEVWLFTFCYALMVAAGLGRFHGYIDDNLIDYMYFSVVTYTSLGLGDVYPSGGLRLLTGVEALVGLLMIGWSASYSYLAMEQLWREHSKRRHPDA